jgi:hypothetical protein
MVPRRNNVFHTVLPLFSHHTNDSNTPQALSERQTSDQLTIIRLQHMTSNNTFLAEKLQRRRELEILEEEVRKQQSVARVSATVAICEGLLPVRSNQQSQKRTLPFPVQFASFPETYEDAEAYLVLGGGIDEWDSEGSSVTRQMLTTLADLKMTMTALKANLDAVGTTRGNTSALKVQIGDELFSPFGDIPVHLDIRSPTVDYRGDLSTAVVDRVLEWQAEVRQHHV